MKDEEIVRRAARGDEVAFLAIWNRHRNEVYRFAAWMVGERPAAEDIAQETFLALLQHPERFDSTAGSLRTYLYAIARNICRKRLRLVRPEEDDLDTEGAVNDDPLAALLHAETGEALRTAIAALPVLQREALFLFEFEELSLAETAAALAVDTSVVKARLHRARQGLRKELSWMRTSENL